MKVKELMRSDSIKYCTPQTKLASAAKIMKDSNRGALPVVDGNKKVIGIITDRDICLSLAGNPSNAKLHVKEAMTNHKVHTITAEDSVKDALKQMRRNRIGRLPVTDKSGHLQGMVSINNLLSHALDNKEGIGHVRTKKENLAKTMKALFDRNNEEKA